LIALGRAARRFALPHWKTHKIPLRNSQPIVSFTFDDFPRTALTNGGLILQNYNARGTYYAAMGLMDSFNHEGQHFCLQDLHDLRRDGHELASHTYSHCSALENELAQFSNDAQRGETEICKIRGGTAPGNFSYP
jgi:peptidoglycan/xylan/chitin deacetylase (PgdA/CDA1 family)